MNLVLDETIEFAKTGEKKEIGMVVVRGNSVVMLEAKDRIWIRIPSNYLHAWFWIPLFVWEFKGQKNGGFCLHFLMLCEWKIKLCKSVKILFFWNFNRFAQNLFTLNFGLLKARGWLGQILFVEQCQYWESFLWKLFKRWLWYKRAELDLRLTMEC